MPDRPFVTYDERTDTWTLEHDLWVDTCGYRLLVPGGCSTDLASVPRVLWGVIAPYQLGLRGPLVHDWLYRHGGRITVRIVDATLHDEARDEQITFTRRYADAFLLDLMRQDGVSWLRRNAAYRAVRLCGGSSWQPLQGTT